MAAFEAKTDWKTLKKRENKNYRFVSFRVFPTHKRYLKKNSKKFQKIKKPCYSFFSTQNRLEWVEKERK